MALTPIRMKNKMLSKIHLDRNGQMVISPVKAASDAVSKGISAQPEGPMTAQERVGLPGPAPHETQAMQAEVGTGAPLERVDPEAKAEADKQPEMKPLEQAPAKQEAEVAEENLEADVALEAQPAEAPAQKAPHEQLGVVTAEAPVLMSEPKESL